MRQLQTKIRAASLALAALLCMAQSAWATGELPGIFSVSATKKVQFSQGNLQAVFASAGNSCAWQFADNQYDYVGNAAANNAINGNGSVTAAGKVDLFGWSTASTYYGINNSGDAVDYSGDFVDWGNLAISNGGNTENSGWRTLTRDEWAYLFSNHTFGFATVAGVKGVIIAPDNYAGPAIDSNHRNGQDSFANNTIDVSTWQSTYVPAGVVFLPAAGFRLPWIGQVQENAYYWSSSAVGGDSNNKFAMLLGLINTEFQINIVDGGNWPANDGFSVRLVKNIYTISYDANSGSGAPSEQMKYHGIDLSLSSAVPTRAGYVFKGWNTAADGSGTSYASGATFGGNADTTLYAQWEEVATWTMGYTGTIQTFTAPCSGIYELKVWGAQGGQFIKAGGLGGYATCRTTLTQGETIYIYVGGKGGDGYVSSTGGAGGWNGGGAGGSGVGGYNGSAGGGGATHISKVNNQVIGGGSGQCASLVGTDYIIVAGGGGGASHPWTAPGSGGGTEGGKGTRCNGTSSYQENYSANFYYSPNRSYGANGGNGFADSWACEGSGGGGGGYYGGTANYPNGTLDSGLQDAGGCGGNSACNSAFATAFSTTAGQREGNGKAEIVLLVSQDEIDAHVGKVIGADGKMYKTVAAAQNAGTTASGVIAYWGWAGSAEESGSAYRGLAISLETWTAIPWCTDPCAWYASSTLTQALDSNDGCERTTTFGRPESRNVTDVYGHIHNHQAAARVYDYNTSRPSGSSRWFVPSLGQWNLVAKALTGSSSDISEIDNPDYTYSNLSAKLTAAGASGLGWAAYWSSTEKDGTTMWIFDIGGIGDGRNGGRASTRSKQQCGVAEYLRAFFAFEDATDAVYTISYNANGGSEAPSAQTKDGGIDLTLSSTAPTRASYTFAGWNTAADGSGTSYASGATFTGNVDTTLYAQWGGYGAWAEENGIAGAWNATDESGVPNAFRYVFDQPAGELEAVSGVDVVGSSVVMTTNAVVNAEGFTIGYALDKVSVAGEVIEEGTPSASAEDLAIDFASVKSNAFFKVAVVLESTGGAESRTKALSDTTIGVIAITNAPATAIIGVPFKSLAGDGAISVSNLVHTANLTDRDTLQAYEGDTLHSWTLSNGIWVEDDVVGPNAGTGGADTIKINRGKGVWLTRQNPGEPIYLVGEATTDAATSEIVPGTSDKKEWTIVASPSVEPIDLNAKVAETADENDQILVPTKGAPKNFTIRDGKWGYDKKVLGEDGLYHSVRTEEDSTIPAGRGFWYINSTGKTSIGL